MVLHESFHKVYKQDYYDYDVCDYGDCIEPTCGCSDLCVHHHAKRRDDSFTKGSE